MSGYLDALGLALAITATGWSTLRWIGVEESSAPLRAAFSIALGFVVTILALYLPLAILDRVEFLPALGVLAIGSLYALFQLARGFRALIPAAPGWPLTALLVAVVLPIVAANLVPFRGYDSKAIFALKGKILLYERDVHGPVFQDPDIVHYHPDYPLGVPLLMALAGWTAEGDPGDPQGLQPAQSAEEWVARHDAVNAYMVLASLWIVGIAAAVAGLILRRVRQRFFCLALFALALPIVVVFPAVGYGDWRSVAAGDRPLLLCLGLAGLAFARWLDRAGRAWLLLATLCAAGAVLIKNESILAATSLCVAGFAAGRRGRALWGSLGLAAGVALALLIVQVVRQRIPEAHFDEQYMASLSAQRIGAWLERAPTLVSAIWTTLRAGDTLYFWMAFGLLAGPFAWRAGGGTRTLLVWVVLNNLLCTAVILVTPNHVVWHAHTAINRLWLQLSLPAAALIVEAVVAIWSQTEAAAATPPVETSA